MLMNRQNHDDDKHADGNQPDCAISEAASAASASF